MRKDRCGEDGVYSRPRRSWPPGRAAVAPLVVEGPAMGPSVPSAESALTVPFSAPLDFLRLRDFLNAGSSVVWSTAVAAPRFLEGDDEGMSVADDDGFVLPRSCAMMDAPVLSLRLSLDATP